MTTIGSLPKPGQAAPQPEPADPQAKNGAKAATPVDSNSDASIWRDTSLRYGGYADEVGEFAAPYLGGLGKFVGYCIATVYCMSDLGTTIPKKYRNAPAEMGTGQKSKSAAAETVDLTFFHLVATLLVPPRLIGMAVHSAERVLDPLVLKSAQDALADEADELKGSGNILKKGMHAISKAKLAGEETLHHLISPRIGKIIDNQAVSAGVMSSVQGKVNGMIKRFGSGMGSIVKGTAYLAEKYNGFMPFEAFKDTEMPETLKKNAKFLKEGRELSQRDVAKLVLMKPWPVLVGIGMVPLIAHPFDKLTVKVMDWTIRPLLGKNKIVRGEDGKLKSIHNPSFWGKPKGTAAPAKQLQTQEPSVQPVPQAETLPGLPVNQQPLPCQAFGAMYAPQRPMNPVMSGSPLANLSGPPNAPQNYGLASKPAMPAAPHVTQNRSAFPPSAMMPRPYGPAL
jgi:hypothetical protein